MFDCIARGDIDTVLDAIQHRSSRIQGRDKSGNSLLHACVKHGASILLFQRLLPHICLAFKNESGQQVEDLCTPNDEYHVSLKNFLKQKVSEGEMEMFELWIVKGWRWESLLKTVFDELRDEMNEDFYLLESRFFELRNKIADLHNCVVHGSLSEFQSKIEMIMQQRSEKIASQSLSELLLHSWDPTGLGILQKIVLFEQIEKMTCLFTLTTELINAVDNMERTALHYAAALGSSGKLFYDTLRMEGADLNHEDVKGFTPLAYKNRVAHIDVTSLRQDIQKNMENEKESRMLRDCSPDGNRNEEQHSLCQNETEWDTICSSLGDILVKGLVHIVESRPDDPILYLSYYLRKYTEDTKMVESENRTTCSSRRTNHRSSDATSSAISLSKNEPSPSPLHFTFPPETFQPFRMTWRDQNGNTILHLRIMAEEETEHFMEYLVENQVNLTLRNLEGKTARQLAIERDNKAAKHALDECIVKCFLENNIEAIRQIILSGYKDELPDFYERFGPESFEMPQEMMEFFHHIPRYCELIEETLLGIINGNEIDVLTKFKFTINSHVLALGYDKRGVSMVHHAILENRIQVVDYLLTQFPDTCYLRDSLNRLPIHYAHAKGGEMLSLVLKHFSTSEEEEIVDCRGRSPEYYNDHKSQIYLASEKLL